MISSCEEIGTPPIEYDYEKERICTACKRKKPQTSMVYFQKRQKYDLHQASICLDCIVERLGISWINISRLPKCRKFTIDGDILNE